MQKKVVLPAPPTRWLSLDRFRPVKICSNNKQISDKYRPIKICSNRLWLVEICSNRFWLVKIYLNGFWPGQNLSKLSQLVRGAQKIILFGGFLLVFCPVFCFFMDNMYMTRIFLERNGPSLLFWPQGPLIQSSATPQGSPPPTQQINIRNTNQLSWVIN